MLPAPEHRLARNEKLEALCETRATAGDSQCPGPEGWVSILGVTVHQGESDYKLGMDSHQSCNKKSYTSAACLVSLGGPGCPAPSAGALGAPAPP